MEKQLLLNSVEVVERKTNCVFLLSLCGSFECTLATPVLIFERGAKKIFRCISAKHHTSHNVCHNDLSRKVPQLARYHLNIKFFPD